MFVQFCFNFDMVYFKLYSGPMIKKSSKKGQFVAQNNWYRVNNFVSMQAVFCVAECNNNTAFSKGVHKVSVSQSILYKRVFVALLFTGHFWDLMSIILTSWKEWCKTKGEINNFWPCYFFIVILFDP